jgi:hypothetical protein
VSGHAADGSRDLRDPADEHSWVHQLPDDTGHELPHRSGLIGDRIDEKPGR